jgi:hypothetical protein
MSRGTKSRSMALSNSLRAYRREARARAPSRGQNLRARAGGPPTLNVDPKVSLRRVVMRRDRAIVLPRLAYLSVCRIEL